MESGFVMRPRDGQVFRFDAGSLWLELLLTGGPGDLAVFESLHTPDDLAVWSGQSRLRLSPAGVLVDARELATAVLLRDRLWGLAAALAHGSEPGSLLGPELLALVNAAAAAVPLAPRLGVDGNREWTLPATGAQLLSTVARDVIDVLTGPYAARVRECESGDCRLVFLDTSRPGNRRWCAMERCGNRSKVRALRKRRGPGPG